MWRWRHRTKTGEWPSRWNNENIHTHTRVTSLVCTNILLQVCVCVYIYERPSNTAASGVVTILLFWFFTSKAEPQSTHGTVFWNSTIVLFLSMRVSGSHVREVSKRTHRRREDKTERHCHRYGRVCVCTWIFYYGRVYYLLSRCCTPVYTVAHIGKYIYSMPDDRVCVTYGRRQKHFLIGKPPSLEERYHMYFHTYKGTLLCKPIRIIVARSHVIRHRPWQFRSILIAGRQL